MKIDGPKKSQAAGKAGKSSKTSGSEGAFGDFIAKAPQAPSHTQTTQSIMQVDALLAVQGAEDATERQSRGRMIARCDDVLDKLDTIKVSMLRGDLTVGHMVDVADVIATHREKISDPKLTDLMDEIDLRAQVELAKLEMALSAQKEGL